MAGEAGISEIAGFWRRALAGIIDVFVLGIFGFGLGFVAEDTLAGLGRWGVLVGVIVSVVYFGVMNSRLASGQTIGKMLMGTRVVDANNNPISFARAAVRFLIIGVPGFLGGELVLAATNFMPLMVLLFLLVFGLVFGTFYLLVFNRITRQTLYDLAAGTYVVRTGGEKNPVGKVWRGHFGIIAVIAVLLTGAVGTFSGLLGSPAISKLLQVRATLLEIPEFSDAGVQFVSNTRIKKSGNITRKMLLGTVVLKTNRISDAELAEKVRQTLVTQLSPETDVDAILVVLSYGYNIGIAKRYQSRRYTFPVVK